VDNDGNALLTGALYYRTTTPVGMKVYDGAQWIEASAAQQSLMVTYEFVATSGQTTFSGTDANGATLSYVANSISVSLNGVTLRPGDDYTATNGTSVVLNVAAALNDELMVIAFAVFNVANAVAKTGDTMTGSLLLPAGTVSAPALSTSADTNTGIFVPAADTIAFAEGGTEVARFDSSGNLGIGTSSPGAKLEVKGASATAGQLSIHDGTGDITVSGVTAASLLFQARDSSVRTIAEIDAVNTTTNGTGGAMVFQTRISDTLAERARIDSSGNLLVAKTSTSASSGIGYQVISSGETNAVMSASTNATTTNSIYSTGASAYRFYVGLAGTVFATSTTISAISDQRLKENVQDLDVGLDAVMALKPRKFDWKEGKGKDIKGDRGWIAQEFEQVFPEMVGTWRDEPPEGEEPYKSVGADLIPVLVKAMQQQQQMIETLQAKVAALEAK
jgi:hypothetical protein